MSDSKPTTKHLLERFEEFRHKLAQERIHMSEQFSHMLEGMDRDVRKMHKEGIADDSEDLPIAQRMENFSLEFCSEHPALSRLANDLVVLMKRLGV